MSRRHPVPPGCRIRIGRHWWAAAQSGGLLLRNDALPPGAWPNVLWLPCTDALALAVRQQVAKPFIAAIDPRLAHRKPRFNAKFAPVLTAGDQQQWHGVTVRVLRAGETIAMVAPLSKDDRGREYVDALGNPPDGEVNP